MKFQTSNYQLKTISTSGFTAYVPDNNWTLTVKQPEQLLKYNRGYHHMGNTAYELSNYLGNVQNVISNRFVIESEPLYEEQFDTDIFNGFTDWSLTGNASSTGGSACNYGSSSSMSKPFTLTASAAYILEFDLSINSGSITLEITDGNGVVSSVSVGSGSQAISFVPTTSNVTVAWNAAGNSNSYCIDNIALEEKTGNKLAEVLQYTDYYPYGMPMPGRNGTGGLSYRYALNGMETNPEMSGAAGNSYTTYFRQYDPRLGRWFSTDPVVQPWKSPYQAFDLNPIVVADPRGDKGIKGIITFFFGTKGHAGTKGIIGRIIGRIFNTGTGRKHGGSKTSDRKFRIKINLSGIFRNEHKMHKSWQRVWIDRNGRHITQKYLDQLQAKLERYEANEEKYAYILGATQRQWDRVNEKLNHEYGLSSRLSGDVSSQQDAYNKLQAEYARFRRINRVFNASHVYRTRDGQLTQFLGPNRFTTLTLSRNDEDELLTIRDDNISSVFNFKVAKGDALNFSYFNIQPGYGSTFGPASIDEIFNFNGTFGFISITTPTTFRLSTMQKRW